MKPASIVACVLCLCALAAGARPAAGQMTLVSQSRSVSLGGSPCGSPSASAPGFGPFVQSVSVATGTAAQNSTLSATSIVGTGSTSPTGTGGGGQCIGINGSSSLSVTFTVAQPVNYTFAFTASAGLCVPTMSLTGPGTSVVYNVQTMGNTPQSFSGTLQPGSYTVAAASNGSPDHGTLTACGWNINLSFAFPPGPCCAANGACTTVVASACSGTAGTPGGVCSPDPCLGACCNRKGGQCLVMHSADCATLGLQFLGLGAACSPVTCRACPGDFNGVGGISVQDIFDFLAAYFAGCP
jgi:hypothetical protein